MSPFLSLEEQKAAETATDSFDALPPGRYACRLDTFEPKLSAAGNPIVKVVWKVAKGQPGAGRLFFDYPSRDRAKLARLKSIFLALTGRLDSEVEDLLGRVASVEVGIELDNRPEHAGEKKNRVKAVFAYEGPDLPSEFDPDDAGREFLMDDEGLV